MQVELGTVIAFGALVLGVTGGFWGVYKVLDSKIDARGAAAAAEANKLHERVNDARKDAKADSEACRAEHRESAQTFAADIARNAAECVKREELHGIRDEIRQELRETRADMSQRFDRLVALMTTAKAA